MIAGQEVSTRDVNLAQKRNLAQDLARGGEAWGDAEVVYSAARARRLASEAVLKESNRRAVQWADWRRTEWYDWRRTRWLEPRRTKFDSRSSMP